MTRFERNKSKHILIIHLSKLFKFLRAFAWKAIFLIVVLQFKVYLYRKLNVTLKWAYVTLEFALTSFFWVELINKAFFKFHVQYSKNIICQYSPAILVKVNFGLQRATTWQHLQPESLVTFDSDRVKIFLNILVTQKWKPGNVY